MKFEISNKLLTTLVDEVGVVASATNFTNFWDGQKLTVDKILDVSWTTKISFKNF